MLLPEGYVYWLITHAPNSTAGPFLESAWLILVWSIKSLIYHLEFLPLLSIKLFILYLFHADPSILLFHVEGKPLMCSYVKTIRFF